MKIILPILLLFISATGIASAQGLEQRIRMNAMMQPTNVDSLVMYTLELTESELPHYSGIIYNNDRSIKARGMWKYEGKEFVQDGPFVFFYENGTVESEGNYDRGQKVGEWKRFENNGNPKPPRYYNPETAEKLRQLQSGVKQKN